MVGGKAPFGEKLLDVTIGKGESQVPAHRTGNGGRFEWRHLNKAGRGSHLKAAYRGWGQPRRPALQHFHVEFVSRLTAKTYYFETENAFFTVQLEIAPKDLPKYMLYQPFAAVSHATKNFYFL